MPDQNIEKLLTKGKRFLLKLEQKSRINTVDEIGESTELKGEAKIIVKNVDKKGMTIFLPQLSLVGKDVGLKGEKSGKISVRGFNGTGNVSYRRGKWQLEVNFEAEVLYETMEHQLEYIRLAEDVFVLKPEIFYGKFLGTLQSAKVKKENVLQLSKGIIEILYKDGGLGLIKSFSLSLENLSFTEMVGEEFISDPSSGIANDPNHSSLHVNRRSMRVQPVGFRSDAADMSPTGASLNTQFNNANTIWGKCCIHFDVQPIHIITNATLKTTSDSASIKNSYTDPDANTIEVFFAGDDLTSMGGGVCYSGNSSLAKVVITDNNAGGDNLLAHELGHALSGLHPGTSSAGWWTGDVNTVLVPTGSPHISNPDENTHWNCTNATNPVLVTETPCVLTHDIPNHYIRDFPEDVGTEPNVLPAGRNFYSMSNLWNRQSNSAGGVTIDGQPEHESPIRFNLDETPYTNYMFAKVETLVNIPLRDVSVKFFLKHPGSGGGASNITLIGTVPVPNTLTPTHPETVSIPWQVPVGTPNHSCMFGVVRSPAEPEHDVTVLTWNEVEALVREHNDWVQRNLEMSEHPEGNIEDEQGNSVWSSPMFIVYPFQRGGEALPLSLEIDTTGAERLLNLVLEVPGLERKKVKPGLISKVRLSTRIKPGDSLPLVLNAILPSDAKLGEIFTIDVNPTLGKTQLAGYRFQFRINEPAVVIRQVIDLSMAALYDYAKITKSKAAGKMFKMQSLILKDMPKLPGSLVKLIVEQIKLIDELIVEMRKNKIKDLLGIVDSVDRFKKALDGDKKFNVLSAYRDIFSRLHMLSYKLNQKK